MKVIRNGLIPFGRRFAAINLFGILFARRHASITPGLINHEAIHTAQMRELLYLPFYIIYVAEWLWRLATMRGDTFAAYHAISFEREAYAHASEPDYIATRPHFAQWR